MLINYRSNTCLIQIRVHLKFGDVSSEKTEALSG